MINTIGGQSGPTAYAWVEFWGKGGAYYRKDLVGNADIRDYNYDGWTNDINGTTTTNVFLWNQDWYNVEKRLDMQNIDLPTAFLSDTLALVRLTDIGGNNFQRIFLAGMTALVQANKLTCRGFEPPMDNGPVTVKKNRVLPFKATLLNGGVPVTKLDIVAPPLIQVLYNSGIGDAIDVTNYVLPAGQGTESKQFEFDGTWWHFNLKTTNYTASGTYTVSMVSGDASDYIVDPTCTAQFVK